MKHILITMALGFSIQVSSQAQSTLKIQSIDYLTNETIPNVHFTLSGKVYKSGNDGKVTLILNKKSRVHISHIRYSDTTLVISPTISGFRKIYLIPKIHNLATAEITSRPLEIFAPEKTNVFDFEWMKDTLYILTYTKEKMFRKSRLQGRSLYTGCHLVRIDTIGEIIDTTSLPDYVIGFFYDPRNKLFILCESSVYLLEIKNHSFQLIRVEKSEFESRIEHLNGVSVSDYFYDNYTFQFPEFTHFAMDKKMKTEKPIRTIRDEFTMELFRASYKYMSNYNKLRALRMEQNTGIDKEIYAGFMTGFHQSLYYHPLYAPLFCQNDSVLIFDHHSGYIFFHDSVGLPIDSIAIDCQDSRTDKFKIQILTDRKFNYYYILFKRSGLPLLKPISIESGNIGSTIHLYYKYPENIKIYNNRVYYLYRQTGSTKTKHLFSESL